MRAKRCPECKERFYDATGTAKKCQGCSGTYDASKQVKADAEGVKKANARREGQPQSVDPRTGKPTPPKPAKEAKK